MASSENILIDLLTIVIPTYNRKERLVSTLTSLLSQDLSCVKNIVVIDNCSDYDVFEVEKELDNNKLKFIRNPFNIGMVSNVVNSFLYSKTEWMWLLSDDDIVEINAINTIKSEITKCQNCAIIKFLDVFANNTAEVEDFSISKLEDFIDFYNEKGNAGEMIFMSNSIYNIKVLEGFMEKSFNHAYTQIPHVVLLMTALNSMKKVKFVNSKIVTYIDPEEGKHWAPLDVYLGMSTITYIPFDLPASYKRKLYNLFAYPSIGSIYSSVLNDYSEYKLHQLRSIKNNLWNHSKRGLGRYLINLLLAPIIVSFFKNNLRSFEKIKEFYKHGIEN